MVTQHKRVHQLPEQTDSTLTNPKHLEKTIFSPPRTKKEHVNDIKDQTLLQQPMEIKLQTQKPFQIQHRPRTEQLNDQKDFLFHQKLHKNPNFTQKSNHKQKKILLHEKSLKRVTFTRFSIKNRIKTQTLYGNQTTNKKKTSFCMKNHLKEQPLHAFPSKIAYILQTKKNILMHEKSLKRVIFTRFSNINEIKNQPFAEMKSAETLRAHTDRESQIMDEERARDTSIERESESAESEE